jgi:sulfate transport system permease protein
MEARTATAPAPRAGIRLPGVGAGLGRGMITLYLSVIVLLPLAAVVDQSLKGGLGSFWDAVSGSQSVAALKLTVIASLIVVVINAFFGTIIAWVLVRDTFPGKAVVNAVIDLPFALPTIVAGLTLIALYGANSPIGVNVAFTQTAVVMALLFVTLPFVVRAVQPLLIELDRDMEEAAASLGAGGFTVFRRIIFPNLLPGLCAGIALAFARALGEFGSLVLISGNIPFKTEVSSVFIRSQIESGNISGAAAVSVVLLAASLVLLAGVTLAQRWGSKHERGESSGTTVMPVSGAEPSTPKEVSDDR